MKKYTNEGLKSFEAYVGARAYHAQIPKINIFQISCGYFLEMGRKDQFKNGIIKEFWENFFVLALSLEYKEIL